MRIGITGSYASGKGTVCSFFESFGATVIDTDIIARELVEPGSSLLASITATFGQKFLNADGSLNRRELGKHVFSDPEKTKTLNTLLHPAILQETLKKSSSHGITYVINAPVLFEAGFDEYMDIIITVSTGMESIINRGRKRDGLTEDEIISRISRQFSLKEKESRADYIIDNSGDLENTKRQVIEIWNKIFS
jgi:dephospho-CoA kinase